MIKLTKAIGEIRIMQNTQRNIPLDILRISCMCMIITLHMFSYSDINEYIPSYSSLFWTKSIITSISEVCVNCFVLISGYFAFKTKFKISKLFAIMREVFTYSIGIYIVLISLGIVDLDAKNLLFSLLPSLTRQYWFMTTYIGLYILSPFIKIIAERLNKREFLASLIVGFLLFVVYYNFFFFCDNLNFGGGAGILWFVYVYMCGIYLNKYAKKKDNKQNVKCFLIVFTFNIGSRIPFYILNIITGKEIFFIGASIFGSVYNSIFVFIQSLLFFKIFTDINIKLPLKFEKIIIFLSGTSLATYLIHDNNFFRNILWGKIDFSKISNSIELISIWILIVFMIYILSSIIDVVRQNIDKKIWKKENAKKLDIAFEKKINLIMDKFEKL